jgi:hypothetical protein
MAAKEKRTKKSGAKGAGKRKSPAASETLLPKFVRQQLDKPAARRSYKPSKPVTTAEAARRMKAAGVELPATAEQIARTMSRIDPTGGTSLQHVPEDVRGTQEALRAGRRGFHGGKMSVAWFPPKFVFSRCRDTFGYMSPPRVRATTRLAFNQTNRDLMDALGALMGDPGRDTGPDSSIPAGFTYAGQFIDHDITLDVSSSLDASTDARSVPNMRSPALDLDSLYGRGPALDPFFYAFPAAGDPTAIKMQLGTNRNTGPGGPAGSAGAPGAMQVQKDFDVPRIHNLLNPAASSNTAVIGDPRNDENLIVAQFHQTMLRLHNHVVDLLVAQGFAGDVFVEAKRIVTHHYQWAVVHDFLGRICGMPILTGALATAQAAVGSLFRMPVEFSVAAYRFGHSLIRDQYWVNFNFPNASLGQVFAFIRNPNLPVLSSWVVDFNAFFDTGVAVPVHNKARRIDSVLSPGLETLPGFAGMLAVLAQRNLRRGLALGLPSGQGMAKWFGLVPLTTAQLTQGLPANELAVLQSAGGVLLKRTPLWYYVLREAMVLEGGDRLGPVGARIVANTFVRMLKRDKDSYLNASGGFVPVLPSQVPGDFTFADLVTFAGVTQP